MLKDEVLINISKWCKRWILVVINVIHNSSIFFLKLIDKHYNLPEWTARPLYPLLNSYFMHVPYGCTYMIVIKQHCTDLGNGVSQSLECLKVLPLFCLSRNSCTEAVDVPLPRLFTKHRILAEIFISAPCSSVIQAIMELHLQYKCHGLYLEKEFFHCICFY